MVKVNKEDTRKYTRNSIFVVHLIGLNKLQILFEAVFRKQVNFRCGIGSVSMPISSHIHNAANYLTAVNSSQSNFKKFEVLFSRKQ